jgi:integrase
MPEAAWLLAGPEPWGDFRHYAVNVLAATTGMRIGEIRGLRVENVKRDHVEIRCSWGEGHGLKAQRQIALATSRSMAAVTQAYCDAIANRLNSCPQFVRPSKNETSG